MTGKLLALSIILAAMVAGIPIYYLQIYAFYDEVVADGETDVVLTRRGDGAVTPIAYQDFQAIDSSSSPIRYRACFTTSEPLVALQSKFVTLETAEPLVAPKWFDCFDAAFLGAQIEQGKARAFLAVENLTYGIDRIVKRIDLQVINRNTRHHRGKDNAQCKKFTGHCVWPPASVKTNASAHCLASARTRPI